MTPRKPYIMRCCARCGRWGTQQYIPASNDPDMYVCSNDHACTRRMDKSISKGLDILMLFYGNQ